MRIYNSISREKEEFKPINAPFVGMYVCGPTVYSHAHLGNCRTFVSFDVIYRYLMHKGYKVRYVRNITDVGHLLDDGEDRMSKGAKSDKLEPMEVAQKYTVGFHELLRKFNNLPPSIEPRATGHIPEQIEMVEQIIQNGYAYEQNGSVYFDVPKFAQEQKVYGKLSGRIIDDLMQESRDLKNQGEKRNPTDFAIWMKAEPEHLMRWNSPWSVGFPGWHLECSAMSTKYLGKQFDIHGGGMDLLFPHHENEIAQNYGACSCTPARHWMHTNMLLLNGKKMSKSDGNTISPDELFYGEGPHVSKPYSPMVVRFFFLQAHYRSTLDMNDQALLASEKGHSRLMEMYRWLNKGENGACAAENGSEDAKLLSALDGAFEAMEDDFSTPQALAALFDASSILYALKNGQLAANSISLYAFEKAQEVFKVFVEQIFGLKDEASEGASDGTTLEGLMQLVISLRKQARENKDWATSDAIRDKLQEAGIHLKDDKEGTTWGKN